MPRRSKDPQRFLTTVLFTDIVGSTERAAELGDKRWRQVLNAHHAAVRRDLKRFGGREIDTAGDGFFATFDQPAQAIRCAEAVGRDVRRLGIEVRAGIHMGEVESIGPKLGGIAVHIGARVMSKAGPSQILVSSTVRDLMSGSDLRFDEIGTFELKGVPGEWRLYAVEQPEAPVDGVVAPALTGEEAARRGIPWSAVAIAAVVALTLVLVPILTTRGRGSPPVTAAPNTVVHITPDRKVAAAVAVGRGPGAIAADGDTVWIANADDGTIQSVDTSSGTASPAIGLGVSAAPNSLAVGGGFVWVLSGTSGQLWQVDPTQAHRITPVPVPAGASGVSYGGGAVWITSNFDDRVLRLDAANLAAAPRVVQLESGAGPEGIAYGGGGIWVAESLKGKVARIDPTRMAVTATVPLLRGHPSQVAYGAGYVWATDTDDDSVTRIQPSTMQGTSIAGVGNGPQGVAAANGAAWVANSLDGSVATIDARTSNVTRISLGASLSAAGIAVSSNGAWVTLRAR